MLFWRLARISRLFLAVIRSFRSLLLRCIRENVGLGLGPRSFVADGKKESSGIAAVYPLSH